MAQMKAYNEGVHLKIGDLQFPILIWRFSNLKLDKGKLEKLKDEHVAKPRNFNVDSIFKNKQCYPIKPFPILNWKISN